MLCIPNVLLASNASKKLAVNEVTFTHAVFWGAAHPDVSSCWSETRTFEMCCVKWDSGALPGQKCWSNGNRPQLYQLCCIAKPDQPPRSFFSCVGRGVFWERLRQTVSLFRSFQALSDTPLEKANPHECLLGGVLASMLTLVHITTANRSMERKVQDYDRAEYLLKVLFSSPVTLEEILASGWPLFLTLDFFRWDPGFQELADKRLPGVMAGDQTMRWSNTLSTAIQAESNGRIPTDLVMKLSSSVAKSEEQVLWQLMPAFVSLVNYHNLRKVDLPRAEELSPLGFEAKQLILLADAQLKAWISLFTHPFSLLIKVEVPLVNLLQALSWPGVVLTHPGAYMADTVHFPGSRLAEVVARPQRFADLPLVEQHIFSGFDAASNMVRTTGQPMCYAPGFLFVILAMAALGSCDGIDRIVCGTWPAVRVWDIGASYGDCLLWAAAVLLSHWAGPKLELRGFEALPTAAAAFKRSAESLREAWRYETSARGSMRNIDFSLLVEELAMREVRESIEISYPSHSMALATFHRCQERYAGEASNNLLNCIVKTTRSETLDTYLFDLPARGPIDVLKIHVQGDELSVLRGARASLDSGFVCLLHMNLETLSLQTDDVQSLSQMAEEVLQILHSGFKGVLVSLWDQRPATREAVKFAILKSQNPDKSTWRPPDAKRPPSSEELHHELVAWTEQGECNKSVAVAAASSLWASMAVAFDSEQRKSESADVG